MGKHVEVSVRGKDNEATSNIVVDAYVIAKKRDKDGNAYGEPVKNPIKVKREYT